MTDARDDSVRAKLFQARVLLINGDLDGAAANRVCADLLLLAAVDPAAGIFLYIDSPGGRLTAGLAVRDTIKYLQADVTTVVIGVAAGTAQLVFSAGTPGRRCALSHARIQLTLPTGAAPPDPFAAGNADTAWDERVLRMIAEDTGLPFGQIATDAREGRWFTAGEALAHGLVDRILTVPPSLAAFAPDTTRANGSAPFPTANEPADTSPPTAPPTTPPTAAPMTPPAAPPESAAAPVRSAAPDHKGRVRTLGAAVESAVFPRYILGVYFAEDRRRLAEDLAEALLEAVPEWREVDAAHTGAADAAEAAARLRSWLETAAEPGERPARPSERLSLREVLHEVASRIDELPLLGEGDRRFGYEAGLRAARRTVLMRGEPTPGQDGPPVPPRPVTPSLPPGLHADRARPGPAPVKLPTVRAQMRRFARVLRHRLVGVPAAECAELAVRLQRSAGAPDPDAYAQAHRQWVLNENVVADLEERLRARVGLTPGEAHRRREIARDLDDLAASLAPVGAATGSFPAAFEMATRRVVAILHSTAEQLRPSWTPDR